MPRDFFPRRDVDVMHFTQQLSEKISLEPGLYGIPLATAATYAQRLTTRCAGAGSARAKRRRCATSRARWRRAR